MWLGIGGLVLVTLAIVAGRIPISFWTGTGALTETPPAVPAQTLEPSETDIGVLPGSKPLLTHAPTLVVTLIGPMTPADRWANALLDRVLPWLEQPKQPGDGFAWWQGEEAIDLLTYETPDVLFKGEHLSIDDRSTVVVYVVSDADANQLQQTADVHVDSSSLVLDVTNLQPGDANMQWVLAGSGPNIALQALVIQAAARSVWLRAAYSADPGGQAKLVLLEAQPMTGPVLTVTGPPTPGQTATVSPLASSPTPTRAPDVDLGVAIEAKLKSVFDVGLAFPPDVVASYVGGHAWHGPLTWDEIGAKIDGRPVNVDQASELIFQILTPNDPRGPAQPFLEAEFTGIVTRFPEEQMYFTGQRMSEILYWMVSYSSRQGGLLDVSYDDFGARQFITIIGFAPFEQPPG